MQNSELEYVGFWARFGASIIDTILLLMITYPLLLSFYGESYSSEESYFLGTFDFIVSWVFPAVAIISFWMVKQATPGKMAISAKIVDAKSGCALTITQSLVRYLAYFISAAPLGLGFIWVVFDDRKQSWHDKIAGTVVVRPKNRQPKQVNFNE